MKERIYYLDALRAYAILLVVVSHAFSGVCAGMNSFPLPVWHFFNGCNAGIRLVVPLFIMISGALVLGSSREEDYIPFVWRRYAKLLAPFVFWSLVYAFYESRLLGTPFFLPRVLWKMLSTPAAGHLYFMYIIFGLYLVAPVIRAYVRQASLRDQAALLGVWFGWITVQFLFTDAIGWGPAVTLLDYSGYFLLGHVLAKTDWIRHKSKLFGAVCLVVVGATAWATFRLTQDNDGVLDERFYYGFTPLVALYAASFFALVRNTLESWEPRPEGAFDRVVMLLSRESYNIYLIHIVWMWLFTKGNLGFLLNERTGGTALAGVTLLAVATMAASLLTSLLLGKIPRVGRWLVLS